MIRVLHRLTTTRVKTAPAGLWADGGNLYLQVTAGADDGFRRSWIFRYALAGKEHQAGLGPTHTINLTEARQKATELRKLLYEGKDPLQHRNALRASTAVEAAKATNISRRCQAAHSIKAQGLEKREACRAMGIDAGNLRLPVDR
jgi:hypothetical protein